MFFSLGACTNLHWTSIEVVGSMTAKGCFLPDMQDLIGHYTGDTCRIVMQIVQGHILL